MHYDTKDGLAGSTVYDLCQDKDGFIWFATEAGVSRFDGTHFKNFTTADGLPETEILKIFGDSKGRVWMAPFKNTVCYYYKGKFYTPKNDSQLTKLKLQDIVFAFAEDSQQNVIMNSRNMLIVVGPDSSADKNIQVIPWRSQILTVNTNLFPTVAFYANDSMFLLKNGQAIYQFTLSQRKGDSMITQIFPNHQAAHVKTPVQITSSCSFGSHLFLNSYYGSFMLDTLLWNKIQEVFLPEKSIMQTLVDNERNFWFGTAGDGVYKLTSREIKTWRTKNGQSFEVLSLNKEKDRVLAGSERGKLFILSKSGLDTVGFDQYLSASSIQVGGNRLVCIQKTARSILYGFDAFMVKYDINTNKRQISYINTLKSIDVINNDTILVGTGRSVVLMNSNDLVISDTIWPFRSTAACFYNNTYFIGTVDGVYSVGKDKTARYLGDKFPPLAYRTACFARAPDGSLWIGTYGEGLVCMKGDQMIHHITTRQGLTSNICRTFFLHKNFLWVGTDKGINKINLSIPSYPITHYSTADGLPSNIINALYVDSNTVYVGSPAGLTFFDETQISDHSKCDLRILDISISGQSRVPDSIMQLNYRENNLKISFVGISFKSGGDILYRYRMKGLSETWDSTRQTVLEYPSLPSGDYQLELVAENKFGIVSAPVLLPFSIATPFWQTLWFQLLVIGIAVTMTWLVITWRFKLSRQRQLEKADLQERMNELEQQALRSQMNPHFIFNCLNAIQNFIVHNDFETTNQYLTEFSNLIRQTLDNSTKSSISVANEITYLTRYLEMEKMRFNNCFSYHIVVDPSIDRELIHLPAMILQPYVENSVRHGVRYKKDNSGRIDIQFREKNNGLVCIIQDNGIGRKQAGVFKSQWHVEYQSKGMSLTAARIQALNRQLREQITIEVIDLHDDDDQPAGTRIEIYFPHSIHHKPHQI